MKNMLYKNIFLIVSISYDFYDLREYLPAKTSKNIQKYTYLYTKTAKNAAKQMKIKTRANSK